MRFDFLKSLNLKFFERLIKAEDKGTVDESGLSANKYLIKQAVECSKSYFFAVNIGYIIAIIITTIVMIVFDHGQPALLYLVPGTIICVCINALRLGEWGDLWEHNEEEYISPPEGAVEQKEDSSKVKAE